MVKSIRGFFIKLYEAIKGKVTNAYLVLTGKYKIIGDVVIDVTTGEIIGYSSLKRIGSAIKNSVTNVLCADLLYPKPSTPKGKVIRALSVLGINTIIAAGIIFIEGTKFSYLLLLKVIVLVYMINVILEITDYSYSSLNRDKYYYSACSNPVEPLEDQVLAVTDYEAATSEGTLAPEVEASVSEESTSEAVVSNEGEIIAPEEKLEMSLLALAIFVAKYSSKGSLVTANIMYCAFASDFNTLPQGYKMKLKQFYLKHSEEILAISLSIEGEELIPIQQFRSFCKERMFTKDSVYSKAKYSNEFYEMVRINKVLTS